MDLAPNQRHAEALAGAVRIPDEVCRIAQRARINVLIGVLEVDSGAGGAALYGTLLVIDAQGQVAGRYRTPLRRRDSQRTWAPGSSGLPAAPRRKPAVRRSTGADRI